MSIEYLQGPDGGYLGQYGHHVHRDRKARGPGCHSADGEVEHDDEMYADACAAVHPN